RIAARDDVADHEHVGVLRRARELRRRVAFDQLDPERIQLRAHGRVDVGVATGHAMAGGARDRRETAHEGAADAEDVEMHCGTQPGPNGRAPAGIAQSQTDWMRWALNSTRARARLTVQ